MFNTPERATGIRWVPVLVALAALGCKGTITSSAAALGEGAGFGAGTQVATKVGYITDPTLGNINAVSVRVPSRWQFNGWIAQGDTCVTIPFPIYKATSPDGVTTVEQEPDMVWKYGSGPQFLAVNQKDCLPMKGPMSAEDFIKHYAESLKLHYVGADQVPAAVLAAEQSKRDESARKSASLGIPPGAFKTTDDRARAIVTSQNGPFTMKGRIDVSIHCVTADTPAPRQLPPRVPIMAQMREYQARNTPPPAGPSVVTTCTARVNYLNAPEAKFAEVSRTFDAEHMGIPDVENSWVDAWLKRSNEQFQQNMAMIDQMTRRDMAAHAQQFAAQQAAQQASHDLFMNTMNQNFQNSQLINNRNIAARQTAASDVIDYAGDRQTILDTSTGLAYKIPNDVTVGPGGPLIKAHGDGTPW
jgi:hypothetical protein